MAVARKKVAETVVPPDGAFLDNLNALIHSSETITNTDNTGMWSRIVSDLKHAKSVHQRIQDEFSGEPAKDGSD